MLVIISLNFSVTSAIERSSNYSFASRSSTGSRLFSSTSDKRSYSTATTTGIRVGGDTCTGFEPQSWRPERCKKCFRVKEQHESSASSLSTASSVSRPYNGVLKHQGSTSRDGKEQPSRSTWRSRVYGTSEGALSSKTDCKIKPADSSSKRDVGESSEQAKKNTPKVENKDRKVVGSVLQLDSTSPGKLENKDSKLSPESPSKPPGNQLLDTHDVFRGADSDSPEAETPRDGMIRTISYESVASTLCDVSSMVTAKTGASITSERSSTPTESLDETKFYLRSIKAQLEIMENKCAMLEAENSQLRQGASSMFSANDNETIKSLQERLGTMESLYQDYRDENTVLKCELRDLQDMSAKYSESEDLQNEIAEMHDQYREDEIEEFRELQRELEQTAKNCRILQFKLRKAERRNDQTEADRQHLEEKIQELLANIGGVDPTETPRRRELEAELRIAKEVSVRLHNELEMMDEKRCKLEDENFYLKERIRELEAREKLLEQSRRRTFGSNSKLHEARAGTSESTGQDITTSHALRDLQDALERETDLKDQLKFAEDDIRDIRRKLGDLETENESLMRQLAKMTSQNIKRDGKPPMLRSYSEGHAKVELELAEHEAQVLKSRLTKTERENEKIVAKLFLLQKELKKIGGKTDFSDDEILSAVPDIYYKQKAKILEEEVEELRAKLDSYKAEADQTFDTISSSQFQDDLTERASNTSTSSNQIDESRKLQIVEEEAKVLHQRIAFLEAENERLSDETKKSMFGKYGKGASQDIARVTERANQMEKDIHRFIARISELESEKELLSKDVERRKKLDLIKKDQMNIMNEQIKNICVATASVSELREKVTALLKDNVVLSYELKTERTKCRELEEQLTEYRKSLSPFEGTRSPNMSSPKDNTFEDSPEVQDILDSVQEIQRRVGYEMDHLGQRIENSTRQKETSTSEKADGGKSQDIMPKCAEQITESFGMIINELNVLKEKLKMCTFSKRVNDRSQEIPKKDDKEVRELRERLKLVCHTKSVR
ncbi:unnamed protein product [Soboliphyme baturini]|uniref:Protein SOGA2 n=1 Tax=Soboliphyme baturini TaxID=241478 RepID=A0A183IUC6_9BILA|nr:unnamed protein product [Soboliphyme baturini]